MPVRRVPVTRVSESFRRLLVYASRYSAFYRVFAWVYASAVRASVKAATAGDCAVAVFSRNSYATGAFIPGRSDIDLLIVIRDSLSRSVIRTYLRDLYVELERLRRWFPMLDQFPVYTKQGFVEACRLGPLWMRTDAWRCEWGEAELLSAVDHCRDRDPLESEIQGVRIYLNNFHINLRTALIAGHSRSTLAMERSASKIQRAISSPGESKDPVAGGMIAELVATTLSSIHNALVHLPPESTPDLRLKPADVAPQEEVVLDPTPLPPGITHIVSPSSGITTYILDVPVTTQAVHDALAMARPRLRDRRRVLLVTSQVYAFFLRHMNPVLYYKLAAKRAIRGEDIVSRIDPPSETAVRRFYRSEAARMLELSPGLEAGSSASARIRQYEARRARLFRFLNRRDITDNPPPEPPVAPPRSRMQPGRDLLGLMLDDMTRILEESKGEASPLSG